jgi:hypothetical protein
MQEWRGLHAGETNCRTRVKLVQASGKAGIGATLLFPQKLLAEK